MPKVAMAQLLPLAEIMKCLYQSLGYYGVPPFLASVRQIKADVPQASAFSRPLSAEQQRRPSSSDASEC